MNREQHLLMRLSDELGKTQQAIHKAIMFGTEGINPGSGLTHRECIVTEYNHTLAILELLLEQGVVLDGLNDEAEKSAKKAETLAWLRYSETLGRTKN